MKIHLTAEEIIEFVSIDKFSDETVELARRVNSHIISCSECFRLVKAFQVIQQEFEVCERKGNFSEFVLERYSKKSEDEHYAEL